MAQVIDIFSRKMIENHVNMAENDILDLEYVPENTSRLGKTVVDVSSAEAKPVQAPKDAIENVVSTISIQQESTPHSSNSFGDEPNLIKTNRSF